MPSSGYNASHEEENRQQGPSPDQEHGADTGRHSPADETVGREERPDALPGSQARPEEVPGGSRAVASRLKNRHAPLVYLLRSENGCYKIGLSANMKKRMRVFDKWPIEVVLLHTIQSDDASWLELDLHLRFAEKRIRGEWFLLSHEDVQFITSLTVVNRPAPPTVSMTMEEFRKKFPSLRKSSGLTLSRLASAASLKFLHAAGLENGKKLSSDNPGTAGRGAQRRPD